MATHAECLTVNTTSQPEVTEAPDGERELTLRARWENRNTRVRVRLGRHGQPAGQIPVGTALRLVGCRMNLSEGEGLIEAQCVSILSQGECPVCGNQAELAANLIFPDRRRCKSCILDYVNDKMGW